MKSDSAQKSYTVKEATVKLMQFCAYRDRSQKEVEDKLNEMRMIPAAQEQIIIKLMQENFLNEERYARSFVRGKFRIKKWGRIKITQELKQRQISSPIIKIAMTEIEESDYLNTLKELAEKKIRLIKEPDPYKRRQKLSNYLLQKGFEHHLVYTTAEEISDRF
ncbi:RecX family transcriptional regulator [Antarcticibacterium sp. 1MA-6-2]|uniref:regulatory protein RecX n=1 Tax=Antarcticibacterium sp. 1MA-6-2 TaxID=2908210 RepID=UPI001F17ABFE|nr:regulatory protein RecX [Antarcticibacterium sp. 1MA-6-2]UJH89945.1 RecX family transcriptional regulator [Antarcticibacterium sp. 1MA-6-2]